MSKSDMGEDTQVVKKLDAILSFCLSKGHDVSYITKPIREKISIAGEKVLMIIEKIWNFVKENKKGPPSITDIIISGIKIVSYSSSIVGWVCPPASLVGYAFSLIACILRIIFQIIDVRSTLAPRMPIHDDFSHELGGLAETLINTELLIRKLETMAHVEESALNQTLSNVDLQIGINELGNLKSRIEQHMCEGQDDAEKSLHYLKLYVRISTLRQSLLLRISTCLKAKDYSPTLRNLIRDSIEDKIKRDRTYLQFLSVPSLKAIKIAALFDPNEHKELSSYMEELTLPLQDLGKVLHDRVLIIQPQKKESIVLGRPFPSFSAVRAMKSSTDNKNVRKKFKFSLIENKYNVFHIQSPDLLEYLYMNTDGECKYNRNSKKPGEDKDEWKIIRVRVDEEEHRSPTFVLSTRKWPCRFLYVDQSPLQCGRGFDEKKKPQDDILFKLVCPGESPVDDPDLFTSLQGALEKNNEETKHEQFLEDQQPTRFRKNEPNSKVDSFPGFKQIALFLEENDLRADDELNQIEEYFLKSDDILVQSLEEIAGCVDFMKDKTCCDIMMSGISKLIGFNYSLFTDRFPFASICTQLLRICGLILSSTWQIDGIDEYVCDSIRHNSTLKSAISKDIRSLERFAVFLRGIENAQNISERNIRQLITEGKFCEEIESLSETRGKIQHMITKNAKVSHVLNLMITFMRIAILQLVILWQMYALANFPGHSEKDAETVHCIIMLQKKNDQKLIETFYGKHASSMSAAELLLFKDYSKCLGSDLNEHEKNIKKTKEIESLSWKKRFKGLHLVIIPVLETILKDHHRKK